MRIACVASPVRMNVKCYSDTTELVVDLEQISTSAFHLRTIVGPNMNSSHTTIPDTAAAAVLRPSDPIPNDSVSVKGPDFERSFTLDQFLGSYERIGFQANSLGKAISIVNKMVCCDYVI